MRPEKLAGLGKGIGTHRLDVTDGAAVAAFAERLGPVDALCNVAGFVHHGTILEATEAELDSAFDLNVKSMFRTVRAFLPGMIESGPGVHRQHGFGRVQPKGRAFPRASIPPPRRR